jgi:hypothetical protein
MRFREVTIRDEHKQAAIQAGEERGLASASARTINSADKRGPISVAVFFFAAAIA